MIIASSNINLESYHQQTSFNAVEERLRIWTDGGDDVVKTRGTEQDSDDGDRRKELASFDFERELEKVSIEASRKKHHGRSEKKRDGGDDKSELSGVLGRDTKLTVMRLLVERLSGRKVMLYQEGDVESQDTDESAPHHVDEPGSPGEQGGERAGFGIEYDYKEVHAESETTRFVSEGIVTTEDGRRITFDISMEMHRERIDITSFSLRAGDAKLVDPLVANSGGGPVRLSESKMDFDLDQDGVLDKISFVEGESGFLVLDKNGDGVVNDGGELFGPSTGDGFGELSAYDGDANGWIDEADAVYDSLHVWTGGFGEAGSLRSLVESNIGAIYLGNVDTPFSLKNSENELEGQVKSTGVFLKESGGVGTVQQVDLVT
jgi:hypothetical protein